MITIFQHMVSLMACRDRWKSSQARLYRLKWISKSGHHVAHITLPFNKPVEDFVASRQVLKVVLLHGRQLTDTV